MKKYLALIPFFLLPTNAFSQQINQKIEQIINTKYSSVYQWLDSTEIGTDPDTFKQHLKYFFDQNFFETVVDINTYKQNVDPSLLKQKILDLDQLFVEYSQQNPKLSFVYKDLLRRSLKKNQIPQTQALKIQNVIRFLQDHTILSSPGKSSSIFNLVQDPNNMELDCSERVILAIHWLIRSGIELDNIGINIYHSYDDTQQMHITVNIFDKEIDVTQKNLMVHETIKTGKKITFKTVTDGVYFLFGETPNKLEIVRAHIFNLMWSLTEENISGKNLSKR